MVAAGSSFAPYTVEQVESWRAKQFPRLNSCTETGLVYLDHAGSSLFPKVLLEAVTADLLHNPPFHPHSSAVQQERIDAIRIALLKFLGASPKDFSVVFTSGATAALSLIGESFDWQPGSSFGYEITNHTSVVGIRELAHARGASIYAFNAEEALKTRASDRLPWLTSANYITECIKQFRQNSQDEALSQVHVSPNASHLVAFCGESNFDGARLEISRLAGLRQSQLRLFILLDAAKLCASEVLNLDRTAIDFLIISFYKIFGFPTGLGALVCRNSAVSQLLHIRKKLAPFRCPHVHLEQTGRYFGGGAMDGVSPTSNFVKTKPVLHEALEHGTLNNVAIRAVLHAMRHSFDVEGLQAVGKIDAEHDPLTARMCLRRLKPYVAQLTQYLVSELRNIYHATGAPAAVLLGVHSQNNNFFHYYHPPGPTVSFYLTNACGAPLPPYMVVGRIAERCGIYIRTGCFCNAGTCTQYFGFNDSDSKMLYDQGHMCNTSSLISATGQKITGAIRVSLGPYSVRRDIDKFLHFLRGTIAFFSPSFYIHPCWTNPAASAVVRFEAHQLLMESTRRRPRIDQLWIYPIKNCCGISLTSWCTNSQTQGLLWDRIIKVTAKSTSPSKLTEALINVEVGLVFVVDTEQNVSLEKLDIKPLLLCTTSDPLVEGLLLPLPDLPTDIGLALVRQILSCNLRNSSRTMLDTAAFEFARRHKAAFFGSVWPCQSKKSQKTWVIGKNQFDELPGNGFILGEAVSDLRNSRIATDWWRRHVCDDAALFSIYETRQTGSFVHSGELLVANIDSLSAFESASKVNSSMQRFQPNIVVTGFSALEQMTWSQILVSDPITARIALRLRVGTPCRQCTSMRQLTDASDLPVLETFGTLAHSESKTGAYFGVYAFFVPPASFLRLVVLGTGYSVVGIP